MNNDLSLLISRGFFKGGRKFIVSDMLSDLGFKCSIINDELFLKHQDFSVSISDYSNVLMGNDWFMAGFMNRIKNELHEKARNGILNKKTLINKDLDFFINYHLNPLIFQGFYDFRVDFSKIAHNLSKNGFGAVFLNDFLSLHYKNTHFSIKLGKDFSLKGIDFSADFLSLKSDDLFMGFPYCVKFLIEPYKDFVFRGSFDEFKIIACALIDELSEQFR